jgi:hypothetical protein
LLLAPCSLLPAPPPSIPQAFSILFPYPYPINIYAAVRLNAPRGCRNPLQILDVPIDRAKRH